jgi:FlaA1/EpsC-like NDP-sugar epimerase
MDHLSLLPRHVTQERIRGYLIAYIVDLAAFAASALLAFELRFDGVLPAVYLHSMLLAMALWAGAKSFTFVCGGVRGGYWRYTSIHEAIRLVATNTVGSILGAVMIPFLLGQHGLPRSIYLLEWLVSSVLILSDRLIVRTIFSAMHASKAKGKLTKTLIYGAGYAGLALLRELRSNQSLMFDVIGLIDDDPQKVGLTLHGKRVLGSGNALGVMVQKHAITKVLIAIPSATGPAMVRILEFAVDAGVEYKMVPSLGGLIQGTELGKQIRDVSVEDLLNRTPIQLDVDRIRERIQGRVVMVTGAAGSIGSEICRQIAQFEPEAIVGFDAAETPLFQIDREMSTRFPQLAFYPEIGNITRPETLHCVMQKYRPSILYHAAAYKHVPMMERHVFAAVENNIFGTMNVAQAAAANGIEDVVMISTDKAVRPTSMMGVTKRVAELLIRAMQQNTATKFVAVRFGNVLGSNGSVVPIFKEQIAAGGPVTVTHAEMTRYFMTIPEAAQLVLQASSIGKGGEVFVLDMGEPVKIVDLARNLILLSGLQPDRDIKIQFTGLRPGEKLFEELNLQDESLLPTSHSQIKSYVSPNEADVEQIKVFLEDLRQVVSQREVARLVLLLKEMVPEYNPGSQLLKHAFSESNHVAPSNIPVPAWLDQPNARWHLEGFKVFPNQKVLGTPGRLSSQV